MKQRREKDEDEKIINWAISSTNLDDIKDDSERIYFVLKKGDN